MPKLAALAAPEPEPQPEPGRWISDAELTAMLCAQERAIVACLTEPSDPPSRHLRLAWSAP